MRDGTKQVLSNLIADRDKRDKLHKKRAASEQKLKGMRQEVFIKKCNTVILPALREFENYLIDRGIECVVDGESIGADGVYIGMCLPDRRIDLSFQGINNMREMTYNAKLGNISWKEEKETPRYGFEEVTPDLIEEIVLEHVELLLL